jgi:hypothetical protein
VNGMRRTGRAPHNSAVASDVALSRHPDGGEVAAAVGAGKLEGIAAVRLRTNGLDRRTQRARLQSRTAQANSNPEADHLHPTSDLSRPRDDRPSTRTPTRIRRKQPVDKSDLIKEKNPERDAERTRHTAQPPLHVPKAPRSSSDRK